MDTETPSSTSSVFNFSLSPDLPDYGVSRSCSNAGQTSESLFQWIYDDKRFDYLRRHYLLPGGQNMTSRERHISSNRSRTADSARHHLPPTLSHMRRQSPQRSRRSRRLLLLLLPLVVQARQVLQLLANSRDPSRCGPILYSSSAVHLLAHIQVDSPHIMML